MIWRSGTPRPNSPTWLRCHPCRRHLARERVACAGPESLADKQEAAYHPIPQAPRPHSSKASHWPQWCPTWCALPSPVN